MKKFILFFTFFFLSVIILAFPSQKALAGWTKQQAETENHNWKTITASSDGTKLAAAEWGGYVYTSSDSGKTWTKQLNSGAAMWGNITSSADGSKLAVVSWYGIIKTSSDGGVTWIDRSAAFNNFKWTGITYSADGTKIIAIASGRYIYTSSDDGNTWQKKPNSGSLLWTSIVSSADGTKLVAIADYWVYTSTDSGNTWVKTNGHGSLVSSSADGSKLFSVMTDSTTNKVIHISTDSGLTWSDKTYPGYQNATSITSSANGVHLAISGDYVYVSSDSGTTWSKQTAIGTSWNDVVFSSDGNTLAAASTKNVYTYSPSSVIPTLTTGNASQLANTFTTLDGTISDTGGDIVTTRGFQYGTSTSYGSTTVENGFFNPGLYPGYTLTKTCGGGTYHYRAYATNNAGTAYGQDQTFTTEPCAQGTWTQQTNLGLMYFRKVAYSNDLQNLAAIASPVEYTYDFTSVYTSSDGGATWIERPLPVSVNQPSIASSADGKKLVVANSSYGYIYTSTDSGATWTQRASNTCWRDVTSSADGVNLAAVAHCGGNSGYVWTSADSGVTWTSRYAQKQWTVIAGSADGSTLIANDGSYLGDFYISTTTGATWVKNISFGDASTITVSADGNKMAAVIGNGDANISISLNRGVTWLTKTTPTDTSRVKYSADGTKLLAGGSYPSNHLYLSLDNGSSWLEQTGISTSTTLNFSVLAISADGSKLAAGGNSSDYFYTYGPPVTNPPVTTDNTDALSHKGFVNITLSCVDSIFGCLKTYYTTDGTTPTEASSQGTNVIFSNEGNYTLKYFSVNSNGNKEQVKTASNSIIIDNTAPVILTNSINIASSSASITWTTDTNSSSLVDYGLTANYGSQTSEEDTTTRVTSHTITLDNLPACATYYYRIHSSDYALNEVVSPGYTFTTPGCTALTQPTALSSTKMALETGGNLSLDGQTAGLQLVVPTLFSSSDMTFQSHELSLQDVVDFTKAPVGFSPIGNYAYELKAYNDDSNVISSFDSNLKVTLSYDTSSINKSQNNLIIYSWDGSAWIQLNNCVTDSVNGTVTCDTNHFSTFGIFNQLQYTISYLAGSNGTISGITSQTIDYSASSNPVTAMPNSGYHFVSWSDGVLTPTRTETDVISSISVTANFAQDNNNSGTPIPLPTAVGSGNSSVSIAMGESANVGPITNTGVNILAYINSKATFSTPQTNATYSITISNLDLVNNVITLTIASTPQTITLKKGETKVVSLTGDSKNNIQLTFANIYVNRAEVTVKNIAITTTPVIVTTPVVTTPVKSVIKAFFFTKDLKLNSSNADVKELQKLLNTKGYIIAKTGAGSKGQETTKFGPATKAALIKFQKTNKITPASGLFGPLTRKVINNIK